MGGAGTPEAEVNMKTAGACMVDKTRRVNILYPVDRVDAITHQ